VSNAAISTYQRGRKFENFGVTVVDIEKGNVAGVRDCFRFTEYLKEGWGELS
jgi:hypothetical protein